VSSTADQAEQPAPAPNPVEAVGFAELWRPAEGASAYRGPERILLERGHISPAQLEAAAAKQQQNPRLSLLEVLVQDEAIDQMVALQAVADYFELPFRRVSPADVDSTVLSMLPLEYVRRKQVLPIEWDNDAIVIGISDPADIFLIDDVKRRIKKPIKLAVTPGEDIAKAVEEASVSSEQKVDEIIKDISEDAVEVVDDRSEEVADLERIAGESPVIRYVNFLIAAAVKDDASDIHIEPCDRRMRVRFRVDGVLFDQQAPPLQMHAAIISRLKIMANLDIAERRLPQDGRIRATVHGRTIDLRVSTLPVAHGEKCVIRLLDNRSIMVGLENLGMGEQCLAAFRRHILQPHGIVLVTGPTGSGKTTTLYSALQVMDGDKLNISTVEDPVEYELDFTNQVSVHEQIGMSFAAAEVRDKETARIAIQASLTGHLVLSTLHTNDAPSSITRLVNIGIEPYLISASVNAILAQRLVRRICENCKQPVAKMPAPIEAYLEQFKDAPKQIYHGTGCEKCRETGYKGRVGIYELLELDQELRDVITANPGLGELRRAASRSGMVSLREDGLQKAAAGLTTVEEIMRVTET